MADGATHWIRMRLMDIREFHEVMLRFILINHDPSSECRELSYPAFVARFRTILGHLIANEEGRYLTIAGSS